ncbi:hypothetical protein HYALB_00005529 [Hymenoscyphus albidus]|uniref:Uncharacterized protein n=1 Tax=Hymenoscyphus albidus TaxID=595503 RepID=A0A9N9M3B4_9HELO|nr:hypothetical protein HYALB_00005529 [Hymenoscyphus albidus]
MSTEVGTTSTRRSATGYLPIENYGLIWNMRTCALVGIDGSIDFILLDKDKGGYFSISPTNNTTFTTKQRYLPSSNILQTRYILEEGVIDLIDFFPRPKELHVVAKLPKQTPFCESVAVQDVLKKWLVRRVECIRGKLDLDVEIFPAFDYARGEHTTEILLPNHPPGSLESKTVVFASENTRLQLDVTIDRGEEDVKFCPTVIFTKKQKPHMKGDGVVARIRLQEGQAISFVLRDDMPNHVTPEVRRKCWINNNNQPKIIGSIGFRRTNTKVDGEKS